MTITTIATEAVMITDVNGLDPIHVFWVDGEPGRGYVTIICFGAAWTAYFGAMGGNTIRQFFARADTDYLVGKMGVGPHLKQSKRNDAYLAKIIDAVKAYLAVGDTGIQSAAQHKARHEELHRNLDELVADWIQHSDGLNLPSKSSIFELIQWSHAQMVNPTGEGIDEQEG